MEAVLMSAKHALLGLLRDRPAHAYELASRLQQRLGPTWAINSGQLSQTIASLERHGLVERVQGSGERRLDTRVIAITERGEAEVERWLSEEPASKARLLRRPLLVKLSLAGPEGWAAALAEIEAYEHECAEWLREVATKRSRVPLDAPLNAPHVAADHVLLRLALGGDMRQLQAELAWARDAKKMIRWLLDEEALLPSANSSPGAAGADTRGEVRKEMFGRMAASSPSAPDDDEEAS